LEETNEEALKKELAEWKSLKEEVRQAKHDWLEFILWIPRAGDDKLERMNTTQSRERLFLKQQLQIQAMPQVGG